MATTVRKISWIKAFLDQGVARCIAFNRRGTLLAAGCTDGTCVIWDFQTRGVAKELCDKDYNAAITSLCWSKCGCQILTSATDKSLTLWDVAEGQKVSRIALQQIALYARLYLGSQNLSLGLACPMASPPILMDFNSNNQYVFHVSAHFVGTEQVSHPRSKFSDGSATFQSVAHDKAARALKELVNASGDNAVAENIKLVGSQCLKLSKEFQDAVNRLPWKVACFSGDSEWVVGAPAIKGEHKICIWDRSGQLVKILEGPKEGLTDLS